MHLLDIASVRQELQQAYKCLPITKTEKNTLIEYTVQSCPWTCPGGALLSYKSYILRYDVALNKILHNEFDIFFFFKKGAESQIP